MKPLSEQTHYEILEIDRDASADEVERAYRLARATYGEESLATYSLLGEDEGRALRDRLELAYEVLSDPTARHHYDVTLGEGGDDARGGLEPLLLIGEEELAAHAPAPAELPRRFEGFDDDEPEGAPWDGARLRRARLARGAEIEEVAGITKINPSYLRFLEDESFEALPASVYVRGFVAAYARCLGLDAGDVSVSYMERVYEQRGERRLESRSHVG